MRRASPKVLRLSVAIAGVGLAGMLGVASAQAAPPKTLGVFQSTVTNANTHQSSTAKIVGASGGFAVYTLTGDSKSHPQCRGSVCRAIWPWVTIPNGKTPTKNPSIKAKLGVWKHDGVRQLTLGGHPLYFYSGDKKKKHANGEGIASFGGTWHVWKISGSVPASSSPMPSPMPTPMPNPNPNPYPTYP
jgi:predicted lipoprotein with Yx(FWY)xxD motif